MAFGYGSYYTVGVRKGATWSEQTYGIDSRLQAELEANYWLTVASIATNGGIECGVKVASLLDFHTC